jgi:hypothetical protein
VCETYAINSQPVELAQDVLDHTYWLADAETFIVFKAESLRQQLADEPAPDVYDDARVFSNVSTTSRNALSISTVVTIPTNTPLSMTGRPPTLCRSINRVAS